MKIRAADALTKLCRAPAAQTVAAVATILAGATDLTRAQDAGSEPLQEVVVTGMRASIESASAVKKSNESIVEAACSETSSISEALVISAKSRCSPPSTPSVRAQRCRFLISRGRSPHPLPQPQIARRGAYVDRARPRDDVPRRIGDRPVSKPIGCNVQAQALCHTRTQRDPLEVGERAHREIDSGGRRLGRAEVNLHYLVGRACANVADRATDVESSVGRAPHRQTRVLKACVGEAMAEWEQRLDAFAIEPAVADVDSLGVLGAAGNASR